ncbi:MAG: T9SS type A sorting domain-containing protein [Flavobacteriales bacterium]|nr:T9SS type A sorting domain-containing protein [Flavobacteriales bacterium]
MLRALRFLLSASILFTFSAHAQTWCPPGATWTYGTDMFGLYGYQQYSYVGDTVLGGLTGQRITGQGAMSYFGQSQVDYWSDTIGFVTAVDGDVIVIWSVDEQDWDTLFWLGALPGDGWLRRNGPYGACDPRDSIVVIDTSTVVVDGLVLRQWEAEQRWDGGSMGSISFTERIGWDWSFEPYPACLIIDGPSGMRCYSDQDISVSFTNFGCESLVGLGEIGLGSRFSAFPNPGTDQFTLQLPQGKHMVEVFDATGRRVLITQVEGGNARMETGSFPVGLYFVRVDASGALVRWAKE